jgi:hypothetical protein
MYSGANPTIASYNASVVYFYNAAGSLSCFENKNIFLHWKKRTSLLQRWRCSCKFKSRIGSRTLKKRWCYHQLTKPFYMYLCTIVFLSIHYSEQPRVDVIITNFCDFCKFSAKKLAFFSKTNVMIQFVHNLALFWVKNANFFAEFFREKI